MKKYELTDIRDGKARRIIALRDIPRYNVKAGDLGGWVESEHNLSHEGDCWVGDNAWVSGYTRVEDNAWVGGNAWVGDNARVDGNAWVKGNAWVDGNAWVGGNARVDGNAMISGNARVDGYTRVDDNAWVDGNAMISGNVRVDGNAWVAQHGVINSTQDYLVVGPIGSRNGHTTFYRTASGTWVRCGCFNGSINDFAKKVKKTHGNNRYAQEYLEAIDYAKAIFERRNQE